MVALKIKNYLNEFHDGCLIDIQQTNIGYVLSLESAEIESTDLQNDISLSKRGTIKGKLHLETINSIIINKKNKKNLEMPYDYGTIFDLSIQGDLIELQISWRNAPKRPKVNDFWTITIKAKKIWWENIPDLCDRFW